MTSTTCGSNTSHRPSEDTRGCCGVQAKLSLNKFFDLTVDEFTGMYTGTLPEADDQQDVADSLASGSMSTKYGRQSTEGVPVVVDCR